MKQGTRGDETSNSDRPHPPALTDERAGDVEARRREVLPHRPGRDRPPELLGPPGQVLLGVGVGGAVGAAVGLPVGLVVAVDVHAVGGDPAGHGLLVDAGGDVALVVGDVADLPDVDRDEDGAVRLALHDQLRVGAQAFGTLRYLPGISTVLLVALLACSSALSDTLSFLAMPIQ